jgi:hypothetical protein
MVYWEGRNAVGAKNVGVRTFPEERSTKYGTKAKKETGGKVAPKKPDFDRAM